MVERTPDAGNPASGEKPSDTSSSVVLASRRWLTRAAVAWIFVGFPAGWGVRELQQGPSQKPWALLKKNLLLERERDQLKFELEKRELLSTDDLDHSAVLSQKFTLEEARISLIVKDGFSEESGTEAWCEGVRQFYLCRRDILELLKKNALIIELTPSLRAQKIVLLQRIAEIERRITF